MKSGFSCLIVVLLLLCLTSCVTESNRSLEVEKPLTASTFYNGPRASVAIGNFDNRSGFLRGIFSDGEDRLGNQAKTILITHLSQTNRFNVLDRDNMEASRREAEILGEAQDLMGAYYLVTGDVSEFGRREVSDYQFFGIFGRGKRQIAYSKISLNIVDTRSSAVVYSVQGAGEYELSDREVLGFGTTAGYDSTLNGKVLDLSIREAVDRLVEAINSGAWRPLGI